MLITEYGREQHQLFMCEGQNTVLSGLFFCKTNSLLKIFKKSIKCIVSKISLLSTLNTEVLYEIFLRICILLGKDVWQSVVQKNSLDFDRSFKCNLCFLVIMGPWTGFVTSELQYLYT